MNNKLNRMNKLQRRSRLICKLSVQTGFRFNRELWVIIPGEFWAIIPCSNRTSLDTFSTLSPLESASRSRRKSISLHGPCGHIFLDISRI
jgi:hypothetical protein